jgi:beta-glucosidase
MFSVKNTGPRDGAEIAQVYVALPPDAAEPPKRLVGWSKVPLKAGESKEVTVEVENQYLSIYDVKAHSWQLVSGEYTFLVGGSSQSLPLKETVSLK